LVLTDKQPLAAVFMNAHTSAPHLVHTHPPVLPLGHPVVLEHEVCGDSLPLSLYIVLLLFTNAALTSCSRYSMTRDEVGYADIFEEIPITVHNGHLAKAFLYELEERPEFFPTVGDFGRLDLSTNPFLEKYIEHLVRP
jgi:translation initiation factor 3 subunit